MVSRAQGRNPFSGLSSRISFRVGLGEWMAEQRKHFLGITLSQFPVAGRSEMQQPREEMTCELGMVPGKSSMMEFMLAQAPC